MSTTFSGALSLTTSANLTTGYGQLSPAISLNQSWAQGTSTNQFDQVYFNDGSVVASGTPTDLDLIGGGLTQPDGSAFAPVKIVEIFIKNNSAVDTLTIGVGSNPFVSWLGGTTPTVKIPPNGVLCLSAPVGGFAVTAGSADILRIATSGAGPTSYTIQLKGRTA